MNPKPTPDELPQWQQALLARHQLDPAYIEHAQLWFAPLAKSLAEHQKSARRPVLVAVNGCQGSGKTTLCDYLCAILQADHGLEAVALSLDDFYHTRQQRRQLAAVVHPLLATRGVPGTHDMALLQQTLDSLLEPGSAGVVPIPRFDKAADDRRPEADWDQVAGGIDLVLLEGWCLGARPQAEDELLQPVNSLERDDDADSVWRRHVNASLEREFLPLYRRVDQWVMLRAPSFDCVYRWRLEQEQKLSAAGDSARVMDAAGILRFIQHYQRLTGHCLEHLPGLVHHLFRLDEQREVVAYRMAAEAAP